MEAGGGVGGRRRSRGQEAGVGVGSRSRDRGQEAGGRRRSQRHGVRDTYKTGDVIVRISPGDLSFPHS